MKKRALLILFSILMSTSVMAENLNISGDTFRCIQEMTPVKHFFIDNLHGDIEATRKVALSESGGVYPEGSVVQLVPTEVMVKREKGFSPATKDWEFIELDVSKEGSEIRARGFAEVVNRFGGNCFACHVRAKPQFDMICEKDHGCDPIRLNDEMIVALQKTDPRCESIPLSEAEKVALEKLQVILNVVAE
ncbi:hypothetical protein [Vibrio sp. SCSIO 43137]|uniref:hypothetical protein n=1 Tax=Vibrio sp. SCSIO 43137 TaxID=3021011 RepID=UPI0023078A37|nr:hypothetical protein [Vibrio sp. SCSIO 43137]WCE29326.1 hypothetical protein PK654_13500 [Vibrio sp. SCSIO 43137]